MAERLRRYKLSPDVYPRFQYAVTEVGRAQRKYDKLTKEAKLTQAQVLPPFGAVYLNILETEGIPLIESEHLTPRPLHENTDFNIVSHKEAKKLFEGPINQQYPTVYVTRYSGDAILPDYFGNLTILITGDPKPVDSKFSRWGDTYICVSTRKSFAKDISDLLVRYVFSHMRPKTELLECMTKADVTENYKVDVGSALKTIQSKELPPSPVAVVGKTTVLKRTTSAMYIKTVEDNLENSGVSFEKHVSEAKKIRPKLLDAVAEIRTMYKRSGVPEDQHPRTSKRDNHADEQVANELFKQIPEVLGIGYRLDTLVVTLDSSIQEDDTIMIEIMSKIEDFLQSKEIDHTDVNFRFSKSEISKFSHGDVKVGGYIRATSLPGTLGGFVQKGRPEDKICCLISANHILDDEDPGEVFLQARNGDEFMIARTLGRRKDVEYIKPVDIAAAELEDTLVEEPSHLDSSGKETPSRVYDYRNLEQVDLLTGLRVHVWKANYRLGKGKITMPKYHRRITASSIQNLIGIEDPDSDDSEESGAAASQAMATRGDSGSLVCADTPDGDFIHAIGMLMGDDPSRAGASDINQTMYVSCDLQSGMEHMEHKYKEKFRLCNSIE